MLQEKEKKRILYIDDELHQMEAVILYLRIEYDVYTARTVDQALEMLNSTDVYDVVVIDVRMPEGEAIRDENRGRTTGIPFTARLRELGYHMPIIAYTVVHDPAVHDELIQVGVTKVLMKTSPPSKLSSEIKQLLN